MATGGRACQSVEEVSRARRAPLDDPGPASESSKWDRRKESTCGERRYRWLLFSPDDWHRQWRSKILHRATETFASPYHAGRRESSILRMRSWRRRRHLALSGEIQRGFAATGQRKIR